MAPDSIDHPDDAQGSNPEPILQLLSRHREHSQGRRERSQRRRQHRRTLVLLTGVVAALGLVALNVLIWGDFTHLHLVSNTPAAAPKRGVATPSRGGHGHSPPAHHRHTPNPKTEKTSTPKTIRVRLTAARSSSWVEVRAGGATGRVLFTGVVPEGHSIRVAGRRLWARFGSLGNFDLTVNGRPVHPTFDGTVDTVITPSAIRPAPAQTG